MERFLIEILNLVAVVAFLAFPFLKIKGRGLLSLGVITIQVGLSATVAFSVFSNGLFEYAYSGSAITGSIPMRIDYLSAWFMLIISFTFLTGSWYGFQYMKQYLQQESNLTLHIIAFMLAYVTLIDLCIIQNGLVLLLVWEVMALSCFVIVIFEHYKKETLKAGINYFIHSHISLLFLTLAFIWIKVKTGSFDFVAITNYAASQPASTAMGIFLLFFVGFAIKSGFVPFHTWLPLAHPAAPAHVSGIMSGVIIKIGIYGILRVLLLLKRDMIDIGYFMIIVSVVTGLYGVMLAIVQHNLKKLLAYHSIENIGIIGLGIGIGSLGLGMNNQILTICGLGGALLHTLNHSLFKSLLFFTAGNVYQFRHTMKIEVLGGLLKKIPHSGYLFLIGALAICGLPPFNGFVSEFLIYNGLFNGFSFSELPLLLFSLFSILALVLIGGLALLCFTKAFGIVFLGTPRKEFSTEPAIENPFRIVPLYLIALFILLIGLFPVWLNPMLQKIILLYMGGDELTTSIQLNDLLQSFMSVGWYSIGFICLIAFFYLIRHFIIMGRSRDVESTWGCAYTGKSDKMQYTASSFIRAYRKLAAPVLQVKREKIEAIGLYPSTILQTTHPYDKIENWLIDHPIHFIKKLLNRFVFLQNGNIQAYILYGFIFVSAAILLPILIDKIFVIFKFFNQI